MRPSNFTREPAQSFASVMLAFSLLGFLWPHQVNSGGHHHDINFVQGNEIRHPDDWTNGWYTPPRSPGFHDDFGS
jgi:hypothetical protein